MNLIHTLAAYAKLLAPRLPLSTAVRLTYEHQDDYTALAQDLVGLTGGRVLYGDAVEFLTRCAALVALSARPLNASRWDEAAMKRERAARDSVLRKIEAGAPDLLRGLLALVDEQRARLDALAPLAEAAARVREARAAAGLASAAYGVAYDAWRVSPETHAAAVSRCLGESEQARRVLHDAERALLAHLALARGERRRGSPWLRPCSKVRRRSVLSSDG